MSNLNIGVIIGSLRKASFNRQLAHALVGLLPADDTATLIDIGDLPSTTRTWTATCPTACSDSRPRWPAWMPCCSSRRNTTAACRAC